MSGANRHYVLAAGGTGGHMLPAFALANELERRGHHVALITDERGANIPGKPDFMPAHIMPVGRFGKNPLRWIGGAGKVLDGRKMALRLFEERYNMGSSSGVLGLEPAGEGVDEKAYIASSSNPAYKVEVGQEVLQVDPKYFRPTEVDLLIGDATKAKEKLGWEPEYDLQDLINDMVDTSRCFPQIVP